MTLHVYKLRISGRETQTHNAGGRTTCLLTLDSLRWRKLTPLRSNLKALYTLCCVIRVLEQSIYIYIYILLYNRVSVLGWPLSFLHGFHHFPYIHGGRLHPYMYAGFVGRSYKNPLFKPQNMAMGQKNANP